jgi:uncharacterized protein (DUF1810 family)
VLPANLIKHDRGLYMPERKPSEPVRLEIESVNDMIDTRTPDDPYDLNRFVEAQAVNYSEAITELRSARKRSHWMWYVFPQIAGLGHSSMSERYAIRNEGEARAYLAHPVLGQRLIECAEAVLHTDRRTAAEIFGSPDDLKLRSCATLFARVSGDGSVFQKLLDKYFAGKPDASTVEILSI